MQAMEVAKPGTGMSAVVAIIMPSNLTGVEMGGGTAKRMSKMVSMAEAAVTCRCQERVLDRGLSTSIIP